MVFDHDHFSLPDLRFFEVTQVGDFRKQSHVAPMRAIKNPTQLLCMQLRVGVGPKRHTRNIVERIQEWV